MTKEWYSNLPKYYQRQVKAAGLDQASIDRRTMLKGLAAVGGAAAMSGMIPRAAHAATQLSYMTWEGYNDPRIVDPFEAANDAKLNIDLISDSAGAFSKLASGGARDFDVVTSDSPWISRMGPAGICEYLDQDEFADVYDSFYPQFAAPFEPLMHDGKITGLPSRWGWIGPTINTDFTDPDDWRDYSGVFDSKNKDKIALMDWGDWPILPIVLEIGINPYKELDKAELKEIRKALRAVFDNSRLIIGDMSIAQKGLLDGSIVTTIPSGSYVGSGLRKQGHMNIVSTSPDLGADRFKKGIIWLEATAILKNPSNPDLAKKLVRHVTGAEAGLVLSWTDFTSNPSPNASVADKYTPEQHEALQTEYMLTSWERSQFHNIAPNIDDMLEIWQEELSS